MEKTTSSHPQPKKEKKLILTNPRASAGGAFPSIITGVADNDEDGCEMEWAGLQVDEDEDEEYKPSSED